MPLLSATTGNMIIDYSVLFVAYLISITLAGYSQAACAKLFGDDTPQEAGYLSLNPLHHIHMIGFIMFVLLKFGFGPIQPIHTEQIWPRWKDLKLFIIYMSKPVVNLVLASSSLFAMVVLFGGHNNGIARIELLLVQLFQYAQVPMNMFFSLYADTHSYMIVAGMLLLAMVYANVIITPLNIIVQGIHYGVALAFERQSRYLEYAHYFAIFGPLVLIFFFSGTFFNIAFNVTRYSAIGLASLLGIG